MASELSTMFNDAEDPVFWDGSTHHIRCYAHKLNLVVGHGLKALGQKVGNSKPNTPHGIPLPIPSLEVNGEQYESDNDDESDDEDMGGLPSLPDGVDGDEQEDEDEVIPMSEESDMVAKALAKVRMFLYILLYSLFID